MGLQYLPICGGGEHLWWSRGGCDSVAVWLPSWLRFGRLKAGLGKHRRGWAVAARGGSQHVGRVLALSKQNAAATHSLQLRLLALQLADAGAQHAHVLLNLASSRAREARANTVQTHSAMSSAHNATARAC